MTTTTITPAPAGVVSLASAKLICRVEHDLEDALLTGYIGASARMAEQKMRRPILQATYEKVTDQFLAVLSLDHARAQVQWIKYVDEDGVQRALDPQDYLVDNACEVEGSYVAPAFGRSWPATRREMNAVRVRYTAGLCNAVEDVPPDIATWVLQHVKAMYDAPGATSEREHKTLPYLDCLLAPYVVF
jgi:uncharacterized phiE125 gp8 family phage protein